jgi:uncharacterized protein
MNAPFTYHELHTSDLAKAQAFYGPLFGWKFETVPMPGTQYAMIDSGSDQAGGMIKDTEGKAPAMWLTYINVENLDQSAAKAKSLGARILKERTEVQDQGSFVVLADPTGAPIALWEKKR